MKKLNEQIITHAGTNLNKVNFSKECLKKCVEQTSSQIPISENFMKHATIGYMDNFKYKDGKIFADINLFDELYNIIMTDRVIRCTFQTSEKKNNKDIIKIDDCIIVEGSIIDKSNDAERELNE